MPGYQINFDLKAGRNAMGLMNANGDDLVKAMKKVSNARNQQGSTGTNALGSGGDNEGQNKFAQEMVGIQRRINEFDASSKSIENGRKLVESVKNMMNRSGSGVTAKINRMQVLWQSMTETGRELVNDDLKKIRDIRNEITNVLADFSGLRHNGVAVFSKRVGVNQGQMEGNNAPGVNEGGQSMQGAMYAGNARGVYIDFVPTYSNLRQNLIYIRDGIRAYTEKSEITQRFINCKNNCRRIVSLCDEYRGKFTDVGSQLHYAKKKTISDRDNKIRNRQNELSVEAVVGILNRNVTSST